MGKRIRQIFSNEFPPGTAPIQLDTWVRRYCTPAEQDEYFAAQKRQHTYRAQAIADGSMTMDESGDYIWQDAEAKKKNKPADPTWLEYFNRFYRETGIKLIITEIEEDDTKG